jgi:hypothetical protein
MSVAEAKARLLALGEQSAAERKAKGPLGTLKGKAVVGGAAAALLVGLMVARPIFDKRSSGATRARHGPPSWAPRLQSLRDTFQGWREDPRKAKNVKKAAVGGISLGLVMQLARPLLPHLAQFAAAKYAQYRMTKAAAAQAIAQEEVAKAQAAAATAQRRRTEGGIGGISMQ